MLLSCWVFDGGGGGMNQQPELEPGSKYSSCTIYLLYVNFVSYSRRLP